MSGAEQRVVHGSVGDDLVSDDGHDRREHQDDQRPGMSRPGVSGGSGRCLYPVGSRGFCAE
jgi:hypothetical protein